MKPGDILSEQYQLVSSIGRGGMGEVFHAIHLASQSHVAIKVVSRAFIGELLMARLEREAAAAARIKSEFIPQVLDVGRTETGELFLVMELLHGESLSERLKKNSGLLSWDEVREIGDNVLRALIDAHAAGVVHRDLKPGNIFIEYLPNNLARARILDFGVCKLDVADGEKLTVTGESVGTIAYMAPEQIRGASKVDERADLYSFAMVVFEALSGRLAYDAAGQMALLACKLEKQARSLKTVAQVPIPLGLDVLIAKCLSRTPEERYPNAKETLRAWRALGPATVQPQAVPILSSGSVHNPATQTVLTAGTIDPPAPKSRTTFFAIGAGAIALGVGAIVVVAALAHRSSAATPPSGSPETADTSGSQNAATTTGAAADPNAPNAPNAPAAEGAAAAGASGADTTASSPAAVGVLGGSGMTAPGADVAAADPIPLAVAPTAVAPSTGASLPAPTPAAQATREASPPREAREPSPTRTTARSSSRPQARSTASTSSSPTPKRSSPSGGGEKQPTIITDPKY